MNQDRWIGAVLLAGLFAARATAHAEDAQPTAAAEQVACTHHEPLAADAPLTSSSIYNLSAELIDQLGTPLALGSLRGRPVLVTMFYSSCTSICPMLLGQLKQLEALLAPATRDKTHVLLISLDPQRDTPAKLLELAKRHGVDAKRWHFTRTSEASMRKLAALLGIRYRRLPDGEIGHSPLIALLDREGSVSSRLEGTNGDVKSLAKAVEALTAQPTQPTHTQHTQRAAHE
jgi:protein SCO1